MERTGEAGPIKLFSCVKFHHGVRIEMACGRRALAYLTAAFEQNRAVSRTLSAKITETGAAACQIKEQLASERYRLVKLQRQIFSGIAETCANRGNVLRFEEELSGDGLRELTDRIAGVCGGFAAVFTGQDMDYRFCIMGEGDLRGICKAMTQSLGARGGGKPDCQQGTARAERRQIEAFFDELL